MPLRDGCGYYFYDTNILTMKNTAGEYCSVAVHYADLSEYNRLVARTRSAAPMV